MAIIVHVHKRTVDAPEPEANEKQALIRDFLIKTDSKDRDVAVQYLRAKSWDLDRAVQGWERLNKTADAGSEKEDALAIRALRVRISEWKRDPQAEKGAPGQLKELENQLAKKLQAFKAAYGKTADAKPATDSERRERIQRVMQGAGVTEATARNMLEGEEWDVIDAVRELKHMRTLGFVIDAKPTYDAANSAKEDEIDQQIRAKVKQLGGHVSVQVPGLHRKPVQEELLKLAEKYKKLTGQMHRSFENYYG